jgi:hypothetical protein
VRLLHPELPRLQASTDKIIRRLLLANPFGSPLSISNNRVVVYERGAEHIIMSGRVIPAPIRETISTNKKDFLLTFFPLALCIPVISLLFVVHPETHQLLSDIAQKLSTALLTTSVVSCLGLVQTYMDVRKNRLIAWHPTDPSN